MASMPSYIDNVWIYLRKSREDREAEERARREGRDEIETLSRHRNTLLDVAHKYHWNVTTICEEVVSGEFISERPQVQRLLKAVENGEAEAVLVMDIDRLGRGDMEDQGRILRTFRDAATVILTPDKAYDPSDESDEEMLEFQTFMSRRELKMIIKRMQRGRRTSVAQGKYIATRAPFGYDIGEDLILFPNKDADTVRMIFDLHANHHMGSTNIANHLNMLGIKTPWGKTWRPPSVIAILRNEHYAGYIIWRKVKMDKRKGTYRKRKDEEIIRAKGRHEPLVSEELFQRSAEIRANRSNFPVGLAKGIQNPLAGIVICAQCGDSMVRRPSQKQKPHLMCKNSGCKQRSTRLEFVEDEIIASLRRVLDDYRQAVTDGASSAKREVPKFDYGRSLAAIEEDIRQAMSQKNELHDLLEKKVYDHQTYIERNQVLMSRINDLRAKKTEIEKRIAAETEQKRDETDVIPKIMHVVDTYRQTDDAAKQNLLLKSVIRKVVYNKESWQRGPNFSLDFHLKY